MLPCKTHYIALILTTSYTTARFGVMGWSQGIRGYSERIVFIRANQRSMSCEVDRTSISRSTCQGLQLKLLAYTMMTYIDFRGPRDFNLGPVVGCSLDGVAKDTSCQGNYDDVPDLFRSSGMIPSRASIKG
jgi:hypothetical protein